MLISLLCHDVNTRTAHTVDFYVFFTTIGFLAASISLLEIVARKCCVAFFGFDADSRGHFMSATKCHLHGSWERPWASPKLVAKQEYRRETQSKTGLKFQIQITRMLMMSLQFFCAMTRNDIITVYIIWTIVKSVYANTLPSTLVIRSLLLGNTPHLRLGVYLAAHFLRPWSRVVYSPPYYGLYYI